MKSARKKQKQKPSSKNIRLFCKKRIRILGDQKVSRYVIINYRFAFVAMQLYFLPNYSV